MQAHGAALRLRTKDPILVDHLLSNYRYAQLNARDRTMLDFAVKVTQTPDRCTEQDVDTLREAGYSDEDILHIAELTAIFNFNGRIANALGLMPNPEYHSLGRRADTPN
jgi:uncharacterized peroxidase-related enzyme